MFRRLMIVSTLIFCAANFTACFAQEKNSLDEICFADGCIQIEIAQTPEERKKGLQSRRSLKENHGMLFVFSESNKHSFWMKNTLIPLDIIWIDGDKRIASITLDVLPCDTKECSVYTPDKEALYVLEVNAGVAIDLGLEVGDQAVF